MYNILDYAEMMADQERVKAYAEALRRVLDENSIVLDIGTGAGIFALLACRFGACKVYALEPDDIIQVARELAEANGFADRITFIQDESTQVDLAEKATVIIADLHGQLPLFKDHLHTMIDARQRLLAPSGIMIPRSDTLWAALVESPTLYQRFSAPWTDNHFGLNMERVQRSITDHIWWRADKSNECMVVDPHCWATLDYQTLESPNIAGEIKWQIEQACTVHGFRAWFDSVLLDDVRLSNAPDKPELIYGNVFFPWSEPVSLESGDSVSISIQANRVGEEYIWRWNSQVLAQAQPEKIKADFKQSNFFGAHFSQSKMRKQADDHKPVLNENGLIEYQIINMMAQGVLLGDIATELVSRFPERYSDWQQALAYVGELSAKYSE